MCIAVNEDKEEGEEGEEEEVDEEESAEAIDSRDQVMLLFGTIGFDLIWQVTLK